jgi:hypothetical protein
VRFFCSYTLLFKTGRGVGACIVMLDICVVPTSQSRTSAIFLIGDGLNLPWLGFVHWHEVSWKAVCCCLEHRRNSCLYHVIVIVGSQQAPVKYVPTTFCENWSTGSEVYDDILSTEQEMIPARNAIICACAIFRGDWRVAATHTESIRTHTCSLHATGNAWYFLSVCSSRTVCGYYK